NGQCNAFTRDDPGPSETGRGPCLDRNREGLVLDGAHGATIGGLDPADGNTFGDHIDAILIKGGSHDNHLYNNLVGLAADGTCQPAPDIGVGTLYDGLCRLYNVRGLALESGHDNVIGAPGAGNIFGVGTLEVTGGQTSGNLIQANFIGLFADLVTPVRPGFTAMVQAPLHIGGGATLTTIDDNTLSGLEVVGDGTDDTVISNNRIGLLPSGLALPGPDTAFATYWRVWSSGVLVRDGPARVTLSDNTIADTTEACVRVEGLELTVDEVRVADNVLGLGADGRGVTSCEGGALEVRNVDAVVFEDNLIGHCGSEFSETFSVACVRLRGGARGSIVEGNVFGLFRDGRVGPWAGVAPLANPIVILEDAPASVIRDNTMLGAPPYAIYDRAAFLGNITTPADGALITGNRIGLDPDGLHRGAPTDHGILAVGPHAKIGGVLAGQGNHIARAGGAGVRVGNVSGVTLRGNVLKDNAGLGVSLGGESPLVNDALDNDGGPNGSQNHPVVTGFLEAPPRALVALSSIPNRTFTIDVYGVSRPDPSGHGEADLWLGEATLSTDPQGQGS
ncbi:MAG TPA: hypothetical protein PK095_25295, partial [Myxococcota bacterium]|nr:hypothetical protein [Myxococcota bacterium]